MSRVEIIGTSPAVLAPDGKLQRQPRNRWRKREPSFEAEFDRRTLFYDCFRAADGETVLLVGPPVRNLRRVLQQAEFRADDGTCHHPELYSSITVSIVALSDVPANAHTIDVGIRGQEFRLTIQPNYAPRLAGRRILFTTSRNNAPAWLAAWASYHRAFHGVETLVFFDNGSTNMTIEGIAATLEKSGIPEVFIVPWNHKFGSYDSKVLFNPYWAHFAPMGAMSVTLRRFGALASGILNCDVDELVHARSAPDIFAELDDTPRGLLVMHGVWIEVERLGPGFSDHRDFGYRLRDPKRRHCAQRKWVLDPRQPWVDSLKVHPYFHWIEGRPRGVKYMAEDAFYWHFKGINTNWKIARNVPGAEDRDALELDPELADIFSRWKAGGTDQGPAGT